MAQMEIKFGKGTAALDRLRRRFQPKIGRESRAPEYLAERTRRLHAWYATQPWAQPYGKNKNQNSNQRSQIQETKAA